MLQWLTISALALIGLAVLVWLTASMVRSLDHRKDEFIIVAKCFFFLGMIVWTVGGFLQMQASGNPWFFMRRILLLAVLFAIMWGRALAAWIASPLINLFDGGSEKAEAAPLYSHAEMLRKRGKLREAIYAIHEQLEKFPNDFRGQMLLAEIQAESTNDLHGAEATIHRICSQPKHAPGQIAGALNTLADWHLRLDQDIEAARAALQEIASRFPNSELAHHASNRLAHLCDASMLVEARAPRTIVMKPSSDIPAHKLNPADVLPAEVDPAVEAGRLVKHLGDFPDDTEAREQLAKIYVDHYQRLDLATEQLQTLINLPSESPRRIAQWFNLLADLQIRATGETQLAATTLHQLIERFPTQAFSEIARQRLASLELEVKRYAKNHVVKFTAS